MSPVISTWILIATLNGGAPSTPAHTIMIPDMPDLQECRRVGTELDNRFRLSKSLCIEVRKIKP